MAPDDILDLFVYVLIDGGEERHLHDPASAGSKLVRLWEDIVRPQCHDNNVVSQIDALIAEGKATSLNDYEDLMFDRF